VLRPPEIRNNAERETTWGPRGHERNFPEEERPHEISKAGDLCKLTVRVYLLLTRSLERRIMDIDEDDDNVPQLVTLDQHLSDELGTMLKSSFSNVEESGVGVEKDSRKVPITILTGAFPIAESS